MKRNQTVLAAGLATAGLAGLVYWQLRRLFTQEPEYAVEARSGALEIRRYAPVVRAETQIDAESFREAMNVGFRRLARYLFGDNVSEERVVMTSPIGEPAERLPMTAPVAQTASTWGPWTMAFTMPRGRTLESLPHPDDARVRLTRVPARRVAVLRFTGRYSEERVVEKARALRQTARELGLAVRGTAEFAGYDPPSTLPFLRRNEIWVELAG